MSMILGSPAFAGLITLLNHHLDDKGELLTNLNF